MYYAISQASSSLSFPAGWCPTVGIGGHFSGGGYGLLTRKYGLSADNVIDALLVSSTGHVLDRKAMGEDVFWAIRGGGGGVWGAVYAWKIQLVPIPAIITTFKFKRTGTKYELSRLLYKWQFIAPMLDDDFSLAVMVSAHENSSQPFLNFFGLYLGDASTAVNSMNGVFLELGFTKENCKEMSWIDSFVYLAEFETITDFKDRFSSFDKSPFKVKVDYVKNPIPLEEIISILGILEKESHAFIVLNGQGGVMNSIQTNTIPFPHRAGNLYTIDYIVAWSEEEDWRRRYFIEWLRRFYNYMEPFVSKNPRVGYVNYVDLDFGQLDWTNKTLSINAVEMSRTWGEKYFLSNYDRLVRAKTIIDPENVFHHPQSIPALQKMSLEQVGLMKCEKV
ncbi:hypothetical protein AQUCO_00900318v1 [Aquilegia coerulea]|uniref:Berberine/berberine-like domain-containing protein n=1 Tax=Aquilegia coerulea TaxID=218851 RepID=A0A2G5ED19_AQUCA|nr:hypothetical protein AQUCO_00900318v1 [Aquilegia coerulea]